MTSLRNRLPPTNALVTFEAVARHLGFTAAARELGVSQAATSRQVRLLEDHLGVALFSRAGKRVRLTAAGERLQQAAAMAFGHLAGTVEELRRERRPKALTVATSIAFASFWLMPRLAAFHAAYPELELRLATSDGEADWFAEDVDAAVVFGPPGRRGLAGESLFGDQVVAVCRPGYFGTRTAPRTAAELQDEVLLQMESPHSSWLSWSDWLARCGAPLSPGGRGPRGPRFNAYTITMQAALDGRGLALGWRRLIEPHLQDGRLVRVTEAVVVPDETYMLVMPERRKSPGLQAFQDWILAEARADWR